MRFRRRRPKAFEPLDIAGRARVSQALAQAMDEADEASVRVVPVSPVWPTAREVDCAQCGRSCSAAVCAFCGSFIDLPASSRSRASAGSGSAPRSSNTDGPGPASNLPGSSSRAVPAGESRVTAGAPPRRDATTNGGV